MAYLAARITRDTLTNLFYVGLLGVALIALAVVVTRTPSRSIAYTRAASYLPSGAAVYLPERAEYRQGEILVVTVTLKLNQVGITDARRGWRTYPAGAWAQLCDGATSPIIERHPPPFIDENLTGITYIVIRERIPRMKPGAYQLTSASYNAEGGQTVFRVPFLLAGSC